MDVTSAERGLMRRESGFKLAAKNPNSSAYGLWQCIYSTCVTAARATNTEVHTTNPYRAIVQMRWYIKNSKHGTAERALAHQLANAWY